MLMAFISELTHIYLGPISILDPYLSWIYLGLISALESISAHISDKGDRNISKNYLKTGFFLK
jgi:hypothetical protein